MKAPVVGRSHVLSDGLFVVGSSGAVRLATNGKVSWRAPAPADRARAVSHVWVTDDEGVAVVEESVLSTGKDRLRGIDLQTGAELWTQSTWAGLGLSDGAMAVSRSVPGAELGMTEVGALDVRTGAPVWSHSSPFLFPDVVGETLIERDQNQIRAVDPGTGADLWVAPGVTRIADLRESPDGRLVLVESNDGDDSVIDLATGRTTIELSDRCDGQWKTSGLVLCQNAHRKHGRRVVDVHHPRNGRIGSVPVTTSKARQMYRGFYRGSRSFLVDVKGVVRNQHLRQVGRFKGLKGNYNSIYDDLLVDGGFYVWDTYSPLPGKTQHLFYFEKGHPQARWRIPAGSRKKSDIAIPDDRAIYVYSRNGRVLTRWE